MNNSSHWSKTNVMNKMGRVEFHAHVEKIFGKEIPFST
jgi:hypothetical protein